MENQFKYSWEEAVIRLKNKKEQSALIYDAYFDDPISDAAKRFLNSKEWQGVRTFLPKIKGKALDIGAGRGISSYALSTDGWETVALEPDPSDIVGAGAIRQLKKETDIQIEIVEKFGEKLPFPEGDFNLVYCRQALHHANDLKKFCNEVSRVLRTNGTFIATREHVISRKSDLPEFFNIHPLHRYYGGEYAYKLKTYINAIESSGILLTRVLNPFSSEINLYPNTRHSIKAMLAKRLRFVKPKSIPDLVLNLLGYLDNTPGRLYSFIGKKIA